MRDGSTWWSFLLTLALALGVALCGCPNVGGDDDDDDDAGDDDDAQGDDDAGEGAGSWSTDGPTCGDVKSVVLVHFDWGDPEMSSEYQLMISTMGHTCARWQDYHAQSSAAWDAYYDAYNDASSQSDGHAACLARRALAETQVALEDMMWAPASCTGEVYLMSIDPGQYTADYDMSEFWGHLYLAISNYSQPQLDLLGDCSQVSTWEDWQAIESEIYTASEGTYESWGVMAGTIDVASAMRSDLGVSGTDLEIMDYMTSTTATWSFDVDAVMCEVAY